jgi:hypothetical protein
MYGSAIRIVLVCFGGFEVGAYWLDPSLGPIISQVQAAHFKSYGEDGTEGPERQRVEEDVCFQQVSWRHSLDCLYDFSPLPMGQPASLSTYMFTCSCMHVICPWSCDCCHENHNHGTTRKHEPANLIGCWLMIYFSLWTCRSAAK